jgi:hypothetical protein
MTSSTAQHQKNHQPLTYLQIIPCFSALIALLLLLFSDKILNSLLFLAITILILHEFTVHILIVW